MARIEKLEKTLKSFRAEVDMKFKILQQILSNRNAQVAVLKDLLEREHDLSKTLLGHWKNAPVLAANGLSLDCNSDSEDYMGIAPLSKVEIDSDCDYLPGQHSGLLRNRGRITRSRITRKRRRRSATPPELTPVDAEDTGENYDAPASSDNLESSAGDNEQEYPEQNLTKQGRASDGEIDTGADDDQDPNYESDTPPDYIPEGERVYVEYEDTTLPSNSPCDSVWKNFLIDDNSETVLCKLCDEVGVQKVMKMEKRSTSFLYNHLKLVHGRIKYKVGAVNIIPRPRRKGNARPIPVILDGRFFRMSSLDPAENATRKVTGICTLCHKSISGGMSTTSNFTTHLKRLHPDQYLAYTAYKNERTVRKFRQTSN